jgi:hypothetical protein
MDMNEEERFMGDAAIRFGIVGAFLVLGYLLILVGVFWSKLPPEIPLFYSLPWGEQWLVHKNGLLVLSGGMIGLFAADALLAYRLFRTEGLLSRYLVFGCLTVLILMAINLTKIIEVLI